MRFIKKAAPNLSQEFKVFVPSKRLPLCEQKRMLAKELHDFLHIYRKDTAQIRIDMASQLEAERRNKKNRNKLIDEKAFQALLYRCCEAELEEIMSIYMKNSHDSTVFLGVSKTYSAKPESIDTNCFNLTQCQPIGDTINVNTTNTTNKDPVSLISPVFKPDTNKGAYLATQDRLKSAKRAPISPSKSQIDNSINTEPKMVTKKKPVSKKRDDELSGADELSCDSFISNSSEGEQRASSSVLNSRNSSVTATNHKRLFKRKEKAHKIQGGLSIHREYSAYHNQNGIVDFNTDRDLAVGKKRKSIVKSASNKLSEHEAVMTQIYSNSNTLPDSNNNINNMNKKSSSQKNIQKVSSLSLQSKKIINPISTFGSTGKN